MIALIAYSPLSNIFDRATLVALLERMLHLGQKESPNSQFQKIEYPVVSHFE
jgi:hypothetical protein